MIKFLKKQNINKTISFLLCILIMVIVSIMYYKNFITELYTTDLLMSDKVYKTWFLSFGIISFLVSISAIAMLNFYKNKDFFVKYIHKFYFVVALVLGLIYMVIIPLFAQSDEPAHYLRTYEISDGYLITPTKNNLKINSFESKVVRSIYNSDKPAEYKTYEDILEIKNINKNKGDNEELEVRAANYSVLNYFPHLIGVSIGKLFHLSPYYCGMLGRFLSLIICISLLSLGIKLLPYGKNFASILFLSPVVLSYSASFSADGTTIAYIFLLISYILNLRYSKKSLNWLSYLFLTILCICVSICKVVYLPIIFMLCLIPKQCFGTTKKSIIIKIVLIIIGIISSLVWIKMCSITVDGGGTNKWILTSPVKYLIVFVNTIFQYSYSELENIFAGNFLCHGQVNPYGIISFLFILVALISYFNEEKNDNNNFYENWFIILIASGIYVLINTAMYVGNTSELSNVIVGVQGRYLIPILIVFMALKTKKIITIDEKKLWITNIILNYTIMLMMISTFTI